MDLTIVDTLTVRGLGTAGEDTIKAEDLESLILAIADERECAGDTRAAIALERIARIVRREWPRLETIDSEIDDAREDSRERGYDDACEELAADLGKARDLLEYWVKYGTDHDDLPMPDSRKISETYILVSELRGY